MSTAEFAGRVLLAAGGTGLVVHGVRRLRGRPAPPPTVAPAVLRAIAASALAAAARLAWLRRAGRDLPTQRGIHLAPACWPARLARAAADTTPARPVLEAMAGVRAASLFAGVLACCAGLLLAGPAFLPLVPVVVIGSGWFPDATLATAGRRAQRSVEAGLPAALALLAAALRAGRSLGASLEHVAAALTGPLAALCRRVVADEARGTSICHALSAEAALSGSPLLGTAAAMIERRHRLGLPIADHLSQLAEAARAQHHTALVTRAARAVPLAGLVTAAVIAPTCVVALATCLIAVAASHGSWPL